MKSDFKILLINPWIHDFAAYDVWAKPLGLLYIAGVLNAHKLDVSYIDCLDRFHKNAKPVNPALRSGRGPYIKTAIKLPKGLEDVKRNYSRYGIPVSWFVDDLKSLNKKPDIILITSLMTYWASAVKETISVIKEVFTDIPVILGGIYASLCYEHAKKNSGADEVITGQGEKVIFDLIKKHTGFSIKNRFNPDDINALPYPALNLQSKINYVPVLTSRGCPFSCAYCASDFLNPNFYARDPFTVVNEILFWHKKYSVSDFIFFDDALLYKSAKHINLILQKIIDSKIKVRFHTPNALHIRWITLKTAKLMFMAGFETIRLGLETTEFENRKTMDKKVDKMQFQETVKYLKQAGFSRNQIGAYLLYGLPGQKNEQVEESIRVVKENNITPILAYYTPIPHTSMWDKAVSSSRYDLESDPVFTNNAIFPCRKEPFSWDTVAYFKKIIKE